MFGCGTAPPSEQAIPPSRSQEISPVLEIEKTLQGTAIVAEQNPIPELDEMHSIQFVLGSSAISQRENEKLQRAANCLKSDKDLSVNLIGRANDNGSRSLNLAVADARVESVSTFLMRRGVKPRQIKKTVMGGEKFPGTCRSVTCRLKMRRVELIYSKITQCG